MAENTGNRKRQCQVCNIYHEDEELIHNNSPQHGFNFILFQWINKRKALVRNRHGVEITVSCDNKPLNSDVNTGKHYFQISPTKLAERNNRVTFKCKITNRRGTGPIRLIRGVLLYPYPWFSCEDPNNNFGHLDKPVQLEPSTSYDMNVTFCPRAALIGSYSIPVCFTFQTVETKINEFSIARSINISVEEGALEKFDVQESPFTGNQWQDVSFIHSPTDNMSYSNEYPIPPNWDIYFKLAFKEQPWMRGNDFRALSNLKRQMEPGNVTEYNFSKFWHNVLWLEETGQELGLQQYNMERVSLTLLENARLSLKVPGLSEKRPSVIVGDMIDIRLQGDHTGYRGIIRAVTDSTVEIDSVHDQLLCIVEDHSNKDLEFDVKFVLSRLSFERCHRAVDDILYKNLLSCIFPQPNVKLRIRQTKRTINDGELINTTMVNNQEQKTAVRNILNGTSIPYPYIVFGPPGTGKTVTIVEAILQVMRKTKHKILVCAPSNAACDVVAEKLIPYCQPSELIRIMSSAVDINNVHEIIIPYSNYEVVDKNKGMFKKIDSASLTDYRIIVATLVLIGKYAGYYNPDVVFIDEAAQAREPEACIALSMAQKSKQIVLAGDPKQLGPSLSSDAAKRYGLGKSLLERLMESDLYNEHDPNCTRCDPNDGKICLQRNPHCITMLIQNFRNHETILSLPNKLFYENMLQARSARAALDPISKVFVFQKIQELSRNIPKKRRGIEGQPVEFCSLISKEAREGKSPSFYNTKELQMIMVYIMALQALDFGNEDYKVVPEDIGVVTPYIRQVHRLKHLLKCSNLEGVEVGTTETFQGREKRIIIVSTVRAQKDLLLYDKKYKLGFVKNEKRFNVALTRAMSKLIIIGCAHVLATDDKWLSYMNLCESVNGFCGAPFAKRTDEVIREISTKFGDINLDTQYKNNQE